MKIQIEPRNLQTLEVIHEILYKLHPTVLDYLLDMEKDIGCFIGYNKNDKLTFEQRERLKKDDYIKFYRDDNTGYDFKKYINFLLSDGDYSEDRFVFTRLLKYLQVDTDEYIPIKIYVEVEDNEIGKKVSELLRVLERTNAPEQFYLNKREIDYDAYFAKGYNLTMNEEQEKKNKDLFSKKDPEELKKILIKEKLYYY